MEDIVPGFTEEKQSLLAKLEEPINNFLLAKMKLDQFRRNPTRTIGIEEQMKDHAGYSADYIGTVLKQELESK